MLKTKIGFALLAIVVAVSAFAFTTYKKGPLTEPELHWYFVNSSGDITGEVFDNQKHTKSDIIDLTGCQDNTGIDCARGYATEKTINMPAPPVLSRLEKILKY